MRVVLGFSFAAFILLMALRGHAQDVDFLSQLSDTERQWLAENPIVRFAGDPDWLPFEAIDENGRYHGIVAEYLALISGKTGIQFELVATDSWRETIRLARKGAIDVVSGDIADRVLEQNYLGITPYINSRIGILTRAENADITDLSDAKGKRIAFISGYGYTHEILKVYPDIRFTDVENIEQGLAQLNQGRIDALLVSTALGSYASIVQGYSDLKFSGNTRVTMAVTLFVNRASPPLHSIMDKAVRAVDATKHFDILSRWTRIPEDDNFSIDLLPSEREFLRRISPIRFSGDPNWLPYEAFDPQGRYIGQVAEHLELIEKLLDVRFEKVVPDSWSHTLELARKGEIDVISEVENSVLDTSLLFTRSYTESPIVIVMREDVRYVSDLRDIAHRKLGLIRDYGNTQAIRRNYPLIPFHTVESIDDGLIDVASGKLDALLVNSAQAVYHLENLGLDALKIAGKTEFSMRLAFGVNPELAELVPLLNRALDKIYQSEQQREIFDRWTQVQVEERIDYTLVYEILLIAGIILALCVWWIYSMRLEVRRREKLVEDLARAKTLASEANEAKSKFLAVISHELRTPLHGMMGLLELLENTTLDVEQLNTLHLVHESSEQLLIILNDLLDFSRIEANRLEILIEPTSLRHLIEKAVNINAKRAFDKNLTLKLWIAPELNEKILIDPLRVRQIFNNFFSNAIKFTEQGSVTILADIERSSSQAKFVIRVRDTGVGITTEDQTKLFRDFSQLVKERSHARQGTGLGLSICQRLALLMGGKISLDSAPGEGTEVCYRQPAKFVETVAQHSTKWQGCSAAILSRDEHVQHNLVRTLQYYGATCEVMESSTNIAQVHFDNALSLVFVDDALFHQAPVNHALNSETGDIQIVVLVGRSDLSADDPRANPPVLNTTPLQPGRLEILVDRLLGLQGASESLTDLGAVPHRKRDLKLLVADDHPTNRELIARQLAHLGYEADIVVDGQRAVDAWESTRYDGVLTDCHMPELDGYQLARYIRGRDPDVPIIAMTANALAGEEERCLEAGMNALLTKPAGLAELNECLKRWLPEAQVDSDTEAVDLNALDEVFFGRDNVLPMLNSYWEATQQDLRELRRAAASDNREQIASIAHRIKGAARVVRADQVAEHCENLESIVDSADTADTQAAVSRLDYLLLRHKKSLLAALS